MAGALLLTLLFSPQAFADPPPAHGRAPSLDLEGLNHACGVAVDSKGDLYASSAGAGEVKVYNSAHTLLTSISNANEPCGLAVDSKGNLYVSEKATGKVLRYAPNKYPFEGTPVYGAPTTVDSSGKAKGIAVDRTDDRLYVAEGNRVAIYDSQGVLGINELQTVNVSGATGGSFKLICKGVETAAIPFNASLAEFKTALEGACGAGNVEIAKPATAYRVTFVGALGSTDVPMLGSDTSGLTPGTAKVEINEETRGFSGYVGEGSFTDATGVAAYTYIYVDNGNSSLLRHHYYLSVADAATDQVKVFAAKEGSPLKLRRTISGVDHDENPETADQGFGFGPAGTHLAADPGNESRETRQCIQVKVETQEQACTQGHFFLYDDANGAVDEFDATGEFVDQIKNGAFEDAEPTALAVERSGGAGDGTLYVSAGASSGAKLLAFRPLGKPGRDPLPALSRVLTKARAVATDCNGYVYVAAEASIRVYDSAGAEITSFNDTEGPVDLAVDCEGNIYVVDTAPEEDEILTYYDPDSYPPKATTSYTRHEPLLPSKAFTKTVGLLSVAVNPADEHAFVIGAALFAPVIVEFAPPTEASKVVGQCGAGLDIPGGRVDLDVYGATGEVYVGANEKTVSIVKCGGAPEMLVPQIKGGGCPNGEIGANPALAVDQSNGHILEFANNQTGGTAREYDSSGACVTEFGTFSTVSGGYRLAVDNSCALHDPPLTEQTTPKCAATYPANGNVYVASDGQQNKVQPFDVSAFGPLEHACLGICNATKFALKVKKTGTGTGKVTSTPSGIDCGSDCEEEYEEGTKVTLEAKADAGSTFAGWSGSGCSGTGKCEVTMSAAKEVTAEFNIAAKPKFALKVKKTGTGTGKVTSTPSGIDCGSDCEEEYEEGTKVTLEAKADAGSTFAGWSGSGCSGTGKCEVTMSAAKEVTAEFNIAAKPKFALKVKKTGTGTGKVTSTPSGIDCGSDCEEEYEEGTKVTLEAKADAGSIFASWSGSGCSGTGKCEVTMSAAKEVTAEFTKEAKTGFPLTIVLEGTGSGTVTSDKGLISCNPFCSDEYEAGTKVVLTATAAPGSVFYSWKYCDSGSVNGRQCTVTVDKAKTVKATFITTHALEVSKSGTGLGKVQSSPGGVLCLFNCSETTAAFREGTKVLLKQTPAKHFHFVEWLGDCSGSGTCEVTMGEDHGVQAKFAEDTKHLLTLTKSGGGQGTVKSSVAGINCGTVCSKQASAYYQGEVVELTATPGKGSAFKGWSGACTGTGICAVTMSEAKEVTAEFE